MGESGVGYDEGLLRKDPFLAPTPDGVDISHTFLRKLILSHHVAKTRPKGLPDPDMTDILHVVYAIRHLIVRVLESYDPVVFTREIRFEWELRLAENGPFWELQDQDIGQTVSIPRRDMKVIFYHSDLLKDLLFAKEDVLRYIEFEKIDKRAFRLLIVFNGGDDDDEDDDEDDEDNEDDEDDEDDEDNEDDENDEEDDEKNNEDDEDDEEDDEKND